MTKKIVHLTESEMKNLIENSVTNVLNEIGYRNASLAHGANYNAQKDRKLNKTPSSVGKMQKSDAIRLHALTVALSQNVDLRNPLSFIEYNEGDRQAYPVYLNFKEVIIATKSHIVLSGRVHVSSRSVGKGFIEYSFEEGKYYRVRITPSFKVRRICEIEVNDTDNNNVMTCKDLLSFITNFMYSEEDYEHNIDTNGPTISKAH